MATITFGTTYTVSSGQTLVLSPSPGQPAVLLPIVYSLLFLDQGQVQFNSSTVNDSLQAFGDAGAPFSGLIKIDVGAGFTESATGANSNASAYVSDYGGSVSFENDGTLSLSATGNALGLHMWEARGDYFLNAGTFSISGNTAVGLISDDPGQITNTGHFLITGVASATGFQVQNTFAASFNNSGDITVKAGVGGDSTAIGLIPHNQSPFHIINSGTITANHAIFAYSEYINALDNHYTDEFNNPVWLTNTGTINGDIELGAGPNAYAVTRGSNIVNSGTIHGAIYLSANGDDIFDGSEGAQTGGIYLGGGNDVVTLGNDGETVYGGWGAATVTGGTGADTIGGGPGGDSLSGSGGADTLMGNGGDDTLTGGQGNDTLDGGPGTDTAVFSGARSTYTISTSSGTTTVSGPDGTDKLTNIEMLRFSDQQVTIGSGGSGGGGTTMVTVVGGPDGGADVLSLDPTKAMQRLAALYSIHPTVHTSTQVVFSLGGGTSLTLDGTSFSGFDANGVPHAGTITGMTFTIAGVVETTFSNMSLPMVDAWGDVIAAHNGDLTSGPNLLAEIFSGNDTFTANSATGSGADTFAGGAGNDIFNMANSGPGSRTYGGDGDDTFNYGANFQAGDIVDGGAGTDTLNLDGGGTNVYFHVPTPLFGATSLVDVERINLAAGSNYALIFADQNVAPGSTLTIDASGLSASNVVIVIGLNLSSGGALNVTGGAGPNSLAGGSGADTLNGGVGNDFLSGAGGNDTLNGGAGDDYLNGGLGNDTIDGGAGTDIAFFNGFYASYTVTRASTTTVVGPDGSDTLKNVEILEFYDQQRAIGTTGVTMTARAGGDTLVGSAGDDILIAGTGADVLNGGNGTNTAVLAHHFADYTISSNGTATTFTASDGSAKLTNIQFVHFADAQMILGSTGGTLTANPAGDILIGGGGADALNGGAGNDTFYASAGADAIDGGGGTNTVVFGQPLSAYAISFSGGTLTVTGPGGTSTLTHIQTLTFSDQTISLANTLFGSPGNDTLTGTSGNDGLYGFGGDDTLNGGGGNDLLEGGAGNDALNGGSGLDTASYVDAASGVTVTLRGSGPQDTIGDGIDTLTGIENLTGSNFNDTLTASNSGSVVQGLAGDDVLVSGAGDDTLDGGAGHDTASYATATAGVWVNLNTSGPQDTALVAGTGGGTDTLISIENLIGSRYGDQLYAGPAGSDIQAGAGDDNIIGGGGNDTVDGGSGNDYFSFTGPWSAYTITTNSTGTTVSGPDGTDKLTNVEILEFSDRQMVISTSGQTIGGRWDSGGDILVGGKGADHLYASTGGDTLIGGVGQDTMIAGGSGHDSFVFQSIADSKVAAPDLITNWTSGDKIDLSAIDADQPHPGDQAFHIGATPKHLGDLVITYDSVHDRTVIDLYVTNDANPDAEIWVSGNHALTAADFVL